MTLLLATDIDSRVHDQIRGNVARIGGSVNQLVDYSRTKVTDINVIDGGYGYVKKIKDIHSFRNVLGTIRRFWKQEWGHFIHGERISLDRKTMILDMHEAYQRLDMRHTFDAIVSSNVVEHSPNPIFFLLNCYLITKKDGYQYHAIPHYKLIFDMYRKPTTLTHAIEDFKNKMQLDDTTHVQDYIDSAIIKHGWQRKFHQKYPVAYPYMHQHVYDEFNTRELAALMFEEVTNDIIKTEDYNDNIVIFKNTLNKKFVEEYGDIIDAYSKNFLHGEL